MFKRLKPVTEKNSGLVHKDYQVHETRVSDYLRKYGTGHADPSRMPQDTRPEVTDNRDVDQMLDEGFEPGLGTDDLDVMMEIERNREKYSKMLEDIELTKTQKTAYDGAMAVLNDPNSDYEERKKAYEVLEELEQKGKIARARK